MVAVIDNQKEFWRSPRWLLLNTLNTLYFEIELLDDILDIDYILECLSNISASDLHFTKHFELRVSLRRNNIISDVDSIRSIILKDKPVGILKQNETKFKLIYRLDDEYDLTIIISSTALIPISFNLVTMFIEKSNKRLREDNE